MTNTDVIKLRKALQRLMACAGDINECSEDQLCEAANDMDAPTDVREQAAAFLQARSALTRVTEEAETGSPVEKISGFERSLAATDAYDPQSFIDGAKWAEAKLAAHPSPALPAAMKEEPEQTPPEILAVRMIDAWVSTHRKQIPWKKAVEITAILTKMPDDERQRLLSLDEEIE